MVAVVVEVEVEEVMEAIEVAVAVADMEEIVVVADMEEEAVVADSDLAVAASVVPHNVVETDGEEVEVTVVEEAMEEEEEAAADIVVVVVVVDMVEAIGVEEDVTLAEVEASVEAVVEVEEEVDVTGIRVVVATVLRRTLSATMVTNVPILALSKSCSIPMSPRRQALTLTSMTTFPSKLVQDAPTRFSSSRWNQWVRSC